MLWVSGLKNLQVTTIRRKLVISYLDVCADVSWLVSQLVSLVASHHHGIVRLWYVQSTTLQLSKIWNKTNKFQENSIKTRGLYLKCPPGEIYYSCQIYGVLLLLYNSILRWGAIPADSCQQELDLSTHQIHSVPLLSTVQSHIHIPFNLTPLNLSQVISALFTALHCKCKLISARVPQQLISGSQRWRGHS